MSKGEELLQKKTHIAFGVATGVVSINMLPISEVNLLLYGTGLVIGSLLPDIDHPRSTLGRKLPVVSGLISFAFGHRTFCHSILFLVLLYLTQPFLPNALFYGLMVGVMSHLIGDMMTHQGIRLLYPIGGYIKFPITFRTGGVLENILFGLFIVFVILRGYELSSLV